MSSFETNTLEDKAKLIAQREIDTCIKQVPNSELESMEKKMQDLLCQKTVVQGFDSISMLTIIREAKAWRLLHDTCI